MSKSRITLVTEPQVFAIAKTELIAAGANKWLRHLMSAEDVANLKNNLSGDPAEVLIELAARRCYKAFSTKLNPNIGRIRTDSKKYHGNILAHKHGSVMEHSTLTVAVEDCSRVVTHEIVRHRAGTGFSQESLRYVRFGDEMKIWIPSFLSDDVFVLGNIMSLLEHAVDVYAKLVDRFDLDGKKEFKLKKWFTSALRRFIPMGVATGIVVTFNVRALRWFIEQRANPAAEIEIQIVADKIAQLALAYFPLLFQDMHPTKNTELGIPVTNWSFDNSKV